ncbi:MAG: mechanosensitive ion channel family protein [bacterium]
MAEPDRLITVHFDISVAWTTTQQLFNSAIAALPRLIIGALILLLFLLIGRGVRSLARRAADRMARGGNEHRTLELALGRLAQAGIVLLGLLIAFTAAFPSFTPANLVSALGIGGVAIGFAFKDIFQNFLAGLLLLVTRPFVVGDQIRFQGEEGTVEDIQTRATFLKTYDGRRVVIPNGELFTHSVVVNTAFTQRRSQYDIGIGYGDDIDQAKGIILEVLRDAEGVSADPKADVIVVDLAPSTVNLRARWWSDARMGDVLVAQDRVLSEAKRRLTAAGIDLPFPTQQMLFHDQTDTTDGDRRRQREGWPAGTGEAPPARAATIARADRNGADSDQRRDADG